MGKKNNTADSKVQILRESNLNAGKRLNVEDPDTFAGNL